MNTDAEVAVPSVPQVDVVIPPPLAKPREADIPVLVPAIITNFVPKSAGGNNPLSPTSPDKVWQSPPPSYTSVDGEVDAPLPPPIRNNIVRTPRRCNCDADVATAVGVTAAGATGAAAAAPAATTGILGMLGFGQGGVVAGSWAAGVQAGIGNVAAGSNFAIAQSLGAGAALPAIGFIGAAAIGAVAVGGGYLAIKKMCRPNVCSKCGGRRD